MPATSARTASAARWRCSACSSPAGGCTWPTWRSHRATLSAKSAKSAFDPEQLLNADFESLGELDRQQGGRRKDTVFDGIDRLATDPDASRKLRLSQPKALALLLQPVGQLLRHRAARSSKAAKASIADVIAAVAIISATSGGVRMASNRVVAARMMAAAAAPQNPTVQLSCRYCWVASSSNRRATALFGLSQRFTGVRLIALPANTPTQMPWVKSLPPLRILNAIRATVKAPRNRNANARQRALRSATSTTVIIFSLV